MDHRQKEIERRTLLKKRTRELRRHMTPQEAKLWYQFLNRYKIRFHRQYVMKGYILDFYCRPLKLAIEIDGSQHFEVRTEKYDIRRTEVLQHLGIRVMRFGNVEIDRNFQGVCTSIDAAVHDSEYKLER